MLAAIGETFDVMQDGEANAQAPDENGAAAADDSAKQEPSGAGAGAHPPESLITGVVMSARPQFYRLVIWTRAAPASEEDALRARIEAIGRHFKTSVLGFAQSQKLAGPLATEVEFLSHKDSEKKGKQTKKIVVL